MVTRWRMVIRRFRSSMWATFRVGKNARAAVSTEGNSPRVRAIPMAIEVTVLEADWRVWSLVLL